VDVDVRVRGGGTSGQCEACIPAIGKALALFAPEIKGRLKKCKHKIKR